ncbi:MAG: hypothetical protein M1830_006840, partial [Pleopsidium flavum]
MSPTPSARTVRLRGIDRATTSLDDFQNVAIRLSEAGSSRRRFFSSSTASIAESAQPLSKSLAIQNEHFTGTVSFPSVESKRKAITVKNTGGWVLDDKFDSLTILYAPDTADLDICAVHGLGGNAFDTWMATSKMWLRDLLPGSAPFERSRIMTFGYNSTLVDKKSNDRLRDWADELLRQVGYVRSSAEEQERPIVFICHSMGGLVGREAMVRLNTVPNKFDGVKLEHCGLLFLSTPHSGTTQADWNDFLVNLAELTIGVRSHEIVDQLRSFNPASVDSEESFAVMRKIPPFYCLVEGDKTKIAGRDRN